MFDCGTTTKHTSDKIDNAAFLKISPTVGVPSVKHYDEWLIPNLNTTRGNQNKVTGRILQSIVILLSDGARACDIGSIVGMSPSTVMRWFKKLPDNLKNSTPGRKKPNK